MTDDDELVEELMKLMSEPVHPIAQEAYDIIGSSTLPSMSFSMGLERYIDEVDAGNIEHPGFRAPTEGEKELGIILCWKKGREQ